MSDAGTFRGLRERLDAAGFRPRRRLGQNFLVDPNLARAIACTLPLSPASLVLEVGAGTGALTRELANLADVVAVEIDPRLVTFLETEMAGWGDEGARVRLVAADVLHAGALAPAVLSALAAAGARERGYVCVSNLPYAVAGPFLAALAQADLVPRDGVVLTQLEMAERVAAGAGSRAYGTLSVLAGLAWQPRLVRRVPRDVFRPRPNVDSAVVRLGPAQPFTARAAPERSRFARFLQRLFGGRRKVLKNALMRAGVVDPAADLAAAGQPLEWLTRRPEALGPAELFAVFTATAPAAD